MGSNLTTKTEQSAPTKYFTQTTQSVKASNYINYREHEQQVARDFQLSALPRELVPYKIPGIGPANMQRLKEHNINTVDELVGHFFLTNRDEEEFAKFLQQLGIAKLFADDCAANLKNKLGGI